MHSLERIPLPLGGFTTHWDKVLSKWGKKFPLRETSVKSNYRKLMEDPYVYNVRDLATEVLYDACRIGGC